MPFRKPAHILAPVDFSDASRAGLRVAGDLATRFKASLTVLHVETATAGIAEVLAGAGGVPEGGDATEQHLQRVQERLKSFAAETLGGGRAHGLRVIEGLFVAEAIAQYAEDKQLAWICMSASGHRGWKRLLLGSVAAEVVQRAQRPVLTVRGRTEKADDFVFDDFRRVLVATDLGEGAAELVELGAGLAGSHGELTLLHVIEIPAEYGLYGVPLTIPAESLEAAKEWTEGALQRLAKGLERARVQPFHVLAGRPAERILQVEEELQPDVTVVGTHGRHGLDRLMLGSVASRVVRRATGPVLVAPTAQRE